MKRTGRSKVQVPKTMAIRLCQGDSVLFHQDHMLAVHDIHRLELVIGMHAGRI